MKHTFKALNTLLCAQIDDFKSFTSEINFLYDFRICIGMLTPANKFTPTRKFTTVSIVIIRRIILKTYLPTPFDGGVQPDAICGRQPSLQRYLHYYTHLLPKLKHSNGAKNCLN